MHQAFSHVPDLVQRAYDLRMPFLTITDKHTLSGCAEFLREVQSVNKTGEHKILPILGCEFNIHDDQNITCLARNKRGWLQLIRILGSSQDNSVDVSVIQENCSELVVIHDTNYTFSCPTFSFMTDFDSLSSYYPSEEDHLYYQIIVCSKEKKTLKNLDEIEGPYPYITDNSGFLQYDGSNYENFCSLFESFSIQEKPRMPSLKGVTDPAEHLKELCREGWREKQLNDHPNTENYLNRIKEELEVFSNPDLANYMLIIRDIVNYARSQNINVGLRGSAAGCLVSYLIGISDIDPVIPDKTLEYNPGRSLVFSRFYSKGRNIPPQISFSEFPYEDFYKNMG